jgi:hypothetical protein
MRFNNLASYALCSALGGISYLLSHIRALFVTHGLSDIRIFFDQDHFDQGPLKTALIARLVYAVMARFRE